MLTVSFLGAVGFYSVKVLVAPFFSFLGAADCGLAP